MTQPSRELATVTQLPLPATVYEGELVSPDEGPRNPRRVVATVVGATRSAVTHPATLTTARHVTYVGGGLLVVGKRVWEACTDSRPQRMMRVHEAKGDLEKVAWWFEKSETGKQNRHKRRLDWLEMPFRVGRAVLLTTAGTFLALLGLGVILAVGSGDWSYAFTPVMKFVNFVLWLYWFVTFAWIALVTLAAVAVVWALWTAGRSAGMAPTWLQTEKVAHDDAVTPTGVASALAHLKIPEMKKAFKDGWQPEFLTPPVLVNGRGYHTVVSLPMGVTPGMVADQRPVLARNLIRASLEVWPTDSDHRGFLDLWVAHPGSTERAGSQYPLLHEGTVDVFTAVPMGESQRGDLIAPPLMEASMGVGGLPGQGKSNAVRVVMAGAALDPLADLRVYVFAGNGDFDAYAPRLSRYRKGVDESVVTDAVSELRELYREVERRETRLAELGAKKVSRSIASKHPDMRPIVVAFSEVHELFGSELGKEAGELAVNITKRQRKTGIFTMFDTQSSRAAAIPSALVELFKYNACFAVKTWRSNDGFLGDGSFQAGIRATELRPGKDRGTSLVTGITEERFELVNWFYIEADDDTGYDAAADIIDRAMKKAKVAQTAGPVEDVRDPLEDVYELMGDDERMRASELAVMLRQIDPGYLPYRNLDGPRLAEMLGREQVPVKVHQGHPKVKAADVLAAIDRRAL